MRITVGPADTALSIATQYTLSPAYAEAITNYNGLFLDVGVPLSPTALLANYTGYVDIPNEWLKGTAIPDGTGAPQGPLSGLSPTTWIMIAFVAAALVFSDSGGRRR